MFSNSRKTGVVVFCAASIAFVSALSLVLCVKAGATQQPASEVSAQKVNPTTPNGASGLRGHPDAIDFNDTAGWTSMFDGTTLNGWDGNPTIWKVTDGAIVGELPTPSVGTPVFKGTYLVWEGGEPANFEMKLEIKLEGVRADSGIQFRAFPAPTPAGRVGTQPDSREARWNLDGYQFDLSLGASQSSGLIGEVGGRGIIASPGQVVHTEPGTNPRLIATLADHEELARYFNSDDWNQAYLIVHGDTMIQIINGHVMTILIDDDSTKARSKGLIGLQYSGVPSKISFRNIHIRMLP